MDIFALTPSIVNEDVSNIAQRIEMDFIDACRQRRGNGIIQRYVRDAHVEAKIDDMELEMHMRIPDLSKMVLERRYVPRSSGSILLNGKLIGKYLSSCEVMLMNPQRTKIRMMPDHPIRRFYWARQHGTSLAEAMRYSHNRNMFLLVEGETVLSSFCGHIPTTALLNQHDISEVEKLSDNTRCCIFALCLLWNACCPQGSNSSGTPLRGSMGDQIPDIPSYACIEKNGQKMISVDPEDLERKISFTDRLLCFAVHRLYFGIPIMLCCIWLLLTIMSQSARNDWSEVIFPSSVLGIMAGVYMIRHLLSAKKTMEHRFPIGTDIILQRGGHTASAKHSE